MPDVPDTMPATPALEIRSGYQPGCIGRVVALHADYYAKHAGFGAEFEAKVAREMADFIDGFEPARDGLWTAWLDGQIHGAIAISGPHDGEPMAHLRWFITSDALRGRGAGTGLLGQAVGYCDRQGFPGIYLWTFQGLDAARHLYERHGFALQHQQPGSQWGTRVMEQRFVRRA